MNSVSEQETIIQFSRDEDFATIWTSDTTVMTKLDKHSDTYDLIDVGKHSNGSILSKTYKCDKKLVSFRSKRTRREMTDEQKEVLRERMSTIQRKRKEAT